MSLDASLFGDSDFIAVRAALIAEVGAVEAIVLTRIHFRASEDYRQAYEHGGQWWWRAPVTVIASETGLSEKQVRRAIDVLRTGEYVVCEQHRREGNYDHAMSVRVNLTGGQVDVPHRADQDVPQRADLPTVKKVEDTTREDDDVVFAQAWASWPRRDGKAAARKAWAKALTSIRHASRKGDICQGPVDGQNWKPEALLYDTVSRFGAAYGRTTAPKFIPMLSSWLNGERWSDPLPVATDRGGRQAEPERPKQFVVPQGHRIIRDDMTGQILGTEPVS